MILKHTRREDDTYTLSEATQSKNFWDKESIIDIANFCNETRYKLNIVSSTQFRLVKE